MQDPLVHTREWYRGFVPLLLMLLWLPDLRAQLVRPYHRLFSIAEGLPTNMVSDITEDQDGFLWLATGAGISRFDGVEFHNLKARPNDPGSVPNEFMNTISAGIDGMLYAGGNSSKLCIIDPRADTVRSLPIPGVDPNSVMESMIYRIHCDRQGRVWIAHGFRKLTLFDPTTRTFLSQDIHPQQGASMRHENITRILEDKDGSLWLGTMFGLVHFVPTAVPTEGSLGVVTLHSHPDRTAPFPEYDTADHITALIEKGKELLVATQERGLFTFDRTTHEFRWSWTGASPDKEELIDRNVVDMVAGTNDLVWLVGETSAVRIFSGNDGVVRSFDRDLHPNRLHQSTPLFPRASCGFRDRNGHYWFGSSTDGLMLVPTRSGHFQQVFLDPEAADNGAVMKLFKTVRDTTTGYTYALTTTGQGLYAISPDGLNITRHYPYESKDLVCGDMCFRSDGMAYVATEKGLYVFDPATGSFSRPTSSAAGKDILSTKIFRMSLDREERVWLALYKDEPHVYDPSDGSVTSLFVLAPGAKDLVTGRVSFAEVDPMGGVWFAGYNNLPFVLLPDGQCTKLPIREKDEPDPRLFYLNGITFTPDSSIWISVLREGAMRFRYDDGGAARVATITTADGLSTNDVFRIASDKRGRVWIGTLNGLNRYDPSNGSIRQYDITDGLALMEQMYGLDISADGRWVIAGAQHGYAILDLEETVIDEALPIVHFRDITSFGKRLEGDGHATSTVPIELNHDQHQLTFHIRSNERADAPAVRYTYRIPDLDTTWTDAGREERITMAHLIPGDHTFQVRARKGDGPWGPISEARFIIAPPYWATWWFRALMVLLLVGVITLVFRWRLALRTQKVELRFAREQALSEERLRIASDLHDELGSGLSVIKVKSQLALERPGTNPANEVLQQVASSSSELIDSMRQIIWTIRSGQSGLHDLIAYMRSYAMGYLEDHQVDCTFEVDAGLQDRELSVEQRRALLLILKEALHNVVKHAKATTVHIVVSEKERLCIRISDDGVGIPDRIGTDPAHGVGLKSMERRAGSVGGRLIIEQRNGTHVSVELPLPVNGNGPNVPYGKKGRSDTFA